jgi:hypothetical protein
MEYSHYYSESKGYNKYRLISREVKEPADNGSRNFALITHLTISKESIRGIIKTFNNVNNKEGKLCQVIIGSKKISEGISLMRVRNIHIVSPHWHLPMIDQAEARGLREGSHADIKDKKVRIYRHVSINPKDKEDKTIPDILLYTIAEEKDYKNRQINRIVKISSIDCPLTYKRNVIKSDIEKQKNKKYIRECDYSENCNYDCKTMNHTSIDEHGVYDFDVEEEEVDEVAYNLFYSDKEINNVINSIEKLYRYEFYYHIGDIFESLREHSKNIILLALDKIIEEKILIRNKFGFYSYLKEDNNLFYLDKDISSNKTNFGDHIYLSNPFFFKTNRLENLIEILRLDRDDENIKNICNYKKSDKDKFINLTDQLDYKTKILLVEATYKLHYNKKSNFKVKTIMDRYGNHIYTVNVAGKKYICHIMYLEEFTGSSYNVTSQNLRAKGLTRCFNETSKDWDYCDREIEQQILSAIKETQLKTRTDRFKDNPYNMYGTIAVSADGAFRVVDKPKTASNRKAGEICKNIPNKPKIIGFLLRTTFEPEVRKDHKNASRKELIELIKGTTAKGMEVFHKDLSNKSDDELRRLISLMIMDKKKLCESLRGWFGENNLLFEV